VGFFQLQVKDFKVTFKWFKYAIEILKLTNELLKRGLIEVTQFWANAFTFFKSKKLILSIDISAY